MRDGAPLGPALPACIEPNLVVLGKPITSGIPLGAYGSMASGS